MVPRAKPLPNKLYFRIGEVSDIVGVKPYVLRYWETEFTDIKPAKSKSGQRLYKRRDVELLLQVRALLYDQRYTIDGAKQRLKEFAREHREEAAEQLKLVEEEKPAVDPSGKKVFQRLKGDLELLLRELRG